jgi:hypothetical protein
VHRFPSSAGRPGCRPGLSGAKNLHTMPRKGALCEIEDGIRRSGAPRRGREENHVSVRALQGVDRTPE